VEAEGLDEFLVAARDVVRVAVRVQALQVRGDGGVLRRDCRPVLRVGFCYEGWERLAYCADSVESVLVKGWFCAWGVFVLFGWWFFGEMGTDLCRVKILFHCQYWLRIVWAFHQ
jgi:hypothetical protein